MVVTESGPSFGMATSAQISASASYNKTVVDSAWNVMAEPLAFHDAQINGMRVKVEDFERDSSAERGWAQEPVQTTVVTNASFGFTYSNFTVNATSQIMFMYSYTMDNQVCILLYTLAAQTITRFVYFYIL